MKPEGVMQRIPSAVLAFAPWAWIALTPVASAAQTAAQGVGGMRAYWHVFIAYTIAIALVLGWVVSIARRLRDLEERLGQR
jgi:CcmD family protein